MRRYFFFILLLVRINESYFVCDGQVPMFNPFDCRAAYSDDDEMWRFNNVDNLALTVNFEGKTWREDLKWDVNRRVYHLPKENEEIARARKFSHLLEVECPARRLS